jgi:monovalent cation/hydrogen antiporter
MTIEQIATILGLLACVVALSSVGRHVRLPYPTMMVIAGLVIGLVPGLPRVVLDPEVVFLVFLPPILYAAAWNTWWKDFRRNARPISLMAVGLVLATAAAVALVAKLLIPGMSWPVAFLLGAIVSPPDAAAATAIAQRLRVSRRIVTILEGESLVNDAAGLIAYRVALAAIVHSQFSAAGAARDLLVAGIGGVAVGLAAGFILAQLHRRITDPTVTTALTLLAPYMAYLPAELLHASGVLATVAAGLYVSVRSPVIFSPQARMQAIHVWELLVLLLNGLVFVLIGLQLKVVADDAVGYSVAELAWYAFAVSLAAVAVRFAWVFGMAKAPQILPVSRQPPMNWQAHTVIAWTGMRGIVSLAAAMALPLTDDNGRPFPNRGLVILLTFGVIFATLVLQSITLPPLIRWLGRAVADDNEHEEIVARLISAGTALKHLEELAAAAPADRAIEQVRQDYENRVNLAASEVRGELVQTHFGRGRARPEDRVRRKAIAAERAAVVAMRDSGELSEELFRKIERDLDLEESRVT